MWQFINGLDEVFADLEQRTRRACVRFAGQEMPPGTMPERATIGFEVDPHSGRVRLLVDRGLAYEGSSSEVGRWLAAGYKTFDDFAQLRSWLGSTLGDAFRTATTVLDRQPDDTDNFTLNGSEHYLDDVGVKGLRIAMRLGCRMKDLPS